MSSRSLRMAKRRKLNAEETQDANASPTQPSRALTTNSRSRQKDLKSSRGLSGTHNARRGGNEDFEIESSDAEDSEGGKHQTKAASPTARRSSRSTMSNTTHILADNHNLRANTGSSASQKGKLSNLAFRQSNHVLNAEDSNEDELLEESGRKPIRRSRMSSELLQETNSGADLGTQSKWHGESPPHTQTKRGGALQALKTSQISKDSRESQKYLQEKSVKPGSHPPAPGNLHDRPRSEKQRKSTGGLIMQPTNIQGNRTPVTKRWYYASEEVETSSMKDHENSRQRRSRKPTQRAIENEAVNGKVVRSEKNPPKVSSKGKALQQANERQGLEVFSSGSIDDDEFEDAFEQQDTPSQKQSPSGSRRQGRTFKEDERSPSRDTTLTSRRVQRKPSQKNLKKSLRNVPNAKATSAETNVASSDGALQAKESDETDQEAVNQRESYDEQLSTGFMLQAQIDESSPDGKFWAKLHELNQSPPLAVEALRQITLSKLTNHRRTPLPDLATEYQKIHTVISQTTHAGEGNSMIILGARGSGKTALVESALDSIRKDAGGDDFHVIRLDGFAHTDDRIALRDIWRQLGKEMDIEDEAQGTRSYADTLAKLLALLSHPSEQQHFDSTGASIDDDGAGAENLAARSIVFVLDEFDQFTQHARQTLLYNLFDIAQARKAPICVLGLTARLDVSDLLEKRVKSRFSHRYVHVGLPKTEHAFTAAVLRALAIDHAELTYDERLLLADTPKAVQQYSHRQSQEPSNSQTSALTTWNAAMHLLVAHPAVTAQLSHIYHTSRSVWAALTSLFVPLSSLTSYLSSDPDSTFFPRKNSGAVPSVASLLTHNLLPPSSPLLSLLPWLPTLPLALLICAARLEVILDGGACNFNMAYAEYASLAQRERVASAAAAGVAAGVAGRVWGREAARGAWERLVTDGFVMAAGGGMVAETEMCRCEVALEEIESAVVGVRGEMERALVRWCREI